MPVYKRKISKLRSGGSIFSIFKDLFDYKGYLSGKKLLFRKNYSKTGINQFGCISHNTNINNLKSIKQTGGIFTPIEREKYKVNYVSNFSQYFIFSKITKLEEYPGIYTSLLSESDFGNPIQYFGKNNVIIIYSLALLNRGDYHVNITDSNGFISSNTYSKETLKDYPNQGSWTSKNNGNGNECVFHHGISNDFIQEIWVQNENARKKALLYFPKVKIVNTFPYIPKFLGKIDSFKPEGDELIENFCYAFDSYRKDTTTRKQFNYIAVNCGMTLKEAEGFKTIKALDDHLQKYYIMNKLTDKTVSKPRYYPPFNSWYNRIFSN